MAVNLTRPPKAVNLTKPDEPAMTEGGAGAASPDGVNHYQWNLTNGGCLEILRTRRPFTRPFAVSLGENAQNGMDEGVYLTRAELVDFVSAALELLDATLTDTYGPAPKIASTGGGA